MECEYCEIEGCDCCSAVGDTAKAKRVRSNGGLKSLVIAILEEARSKHLIDCINDEYLNEDYHVEVTLTVGEIAKAAKVFGIKSF